MTGCATTWLIDVVDTDSAETNSEPVAGEPPVSRPLAMLGVVVAAIIPAIGVYLFFAIPHLIPQGGIPSAQVSFQTLSPIFFPRVTFILMTILGLIYFVRNLRILHHATEGTLFKEPGTLKRVASLYSIAVIYPFLLTEFGFMLPTALLMATMTLFFGIRVWWQIVLFACVTPVAIRFIFERYLAIALPNARIEWLSEIEEGLMQWLSSIFLF